MVHTGQSKKTPAASSKRYDKEYLFNNFFDVTEDRVRFMERTLYIEGVAEQLFGINDYFDVVYSHSSNDALREKYRNQAKEQLKKHSVWSFHLEGLYDYAFNGIEIEDPTDTVCFAEGFIDQFGNLCEEWDDILLLGDVRFGVDQEFDFGKDDDYLSENRLNGLALLAGVTVRTLQNAISSGEIKTRKLKGDVLFQVGSLKKWLQGRRGYVPTQHIPLDSDLENASGGIANVSSPAEFGAFLQKHRENNQQSIDDLLKPEVGLTAAELACIEAGNYDLSLIHVGPIAEVYGFDRDQVLIGAMNAFFPEELASLKNIITNQ